MTKQVEPQRKRKRSKPMPLPEGSAPLPQQAHKQFQTLNQIAPLRSALASASDGDTSAAVAAAAANDDQAPSSFVCREPVLNRHEQISGYFFNLRENLQSRLQGKHDLLHKIYDDVLLRSLTQLRVNSLLGHRLAFINLSPASLDNALITQLPTENTVIMLSPGRLNLEMEVLQPQLKALRKAGFSYGWVLSKKLLAEHPNLQLLAAQGDYAQIQTADFDGLDLKAIGRTLSASRSLERPPLRLIAHELHSFDEFNLCFQSGFEHFLGNFITSRDNWHPPKSEINRILALKLLNFLRSDEDLQVIAQQITSDPVMTFKLLRHINSPAMGLQTPVVTTDKALLILGRERCYRWISLLLFDIKQLGFRERLLTEQALTRAFFLEGLAGQGNIPDKKDELFILGLFSMLDLLIGHSIESILEQIRLPTRLHDALLGRPGIYFHALQLAKAHEEQHSVSIDKLTTACGLDPQMVLQRSIEALGRANDVMLRSDG